MIFIFLMSEKNNTYLKYKHSMQFSPKYFIKMYW